MGKLIIEEEGVTSIEYGLIATLVALALFVTLSATGGVVKSFYDRLSEILLEVLKWVGL